MARNRIGFIYKGASSPGGSRLERFLFRRIELNLLDDYLNDTAYEHLPPWDGDISNDQMDQRHTQPKVIFPTPEISTGIVNGLMTSEDSRLQFHLDDEGAQRNLEDSLEEIEFWDHINFLLPSLLVNGSAFIKIFQTPEERIMLKSFNSKSCWPVFDASGELLEVTIRYIYDTGRFKDGSGEKIYAWSQQKLGRQVDILYDNPIFEPGMDDIPEFKEVQRVEHNLGFVQGEWLTTSFFLSSSIPDGISYIQSSLPMIDSMNYRLSKEDSAVYYNLFPMLTAYGLSPEDFSEIRQGNMEEVRAKGMNVLATGKTPDKAALQFLEGSLTGLQVSEAFHQRMFQMVQYSLKTVMLDPDRMAIHAQSGRAMEALYKPVIQYIKKIRPRMKKSICSILTKAEKISNSFPSNIEIPLGTVDETKKKWGEIFEDTPADLTQKVGAVTQAVMSKVLSRKTAVENLAPSFGVENVEEEWKQIESESTQEMEDERLLNDMSNSNPTGGGAGGSGGKK